MKNKLYGGATAKILPGGKICQKWFIWRDINEEIIYRGVSSVEEINKGNLNYLFNHSFTHSFHKEFLHATYVPGVCHIGLTLNQTDQSLF